MHSLRRTALQSSGKAPEMCIRDSYYLMGCAAIAIGVFLSSLTENQIIAAVAGVAALLLAYMMPSPVSYTHLR